VSSIPWNLKKTNEGLFYYYLLNRGDTKDPPGRCILESTSVSLNAALLMIFYETRTDWLVSLRSDEDLQHDMSVMALPVVTTGEVTNFAFDENNVA
jgi:hypothetical protein